MQAYAALFFSALISSTLFPGGSEAMLLYLVQDMPSQASLLIATATVGNVLGSVITYAMGKYGFQFGRRWLRISQAQQTKAERIFKRFGTPALLFAWLPIVGDPLCLVAGSLRYPFLTFILLVGIGKLARYMVVALPFI